jgi:hypothetical protein
VTNSDRLLEQVDDLADRQSTERTRAEVARAALLAATYRAEALKKAKDERKDKR